MTRTTQAYTRNTAAEEPPLPSRLVRLLAEARWLALAVLALYLVLILVSYAKTDPGWSYKADIQHIANLGGRVGAWLADLLLFVFGFSAWWWCVLLVRIVWGGYR